MVRTFLGRILTHASEPSLLRPPPPAAALRVRILELGLDAERVGDGGRAAVAGAGEVTRMRTSHLVLGQVDTLQRVGGLVTALRVSLVHTLSLYNIRWMIFLVIICNIVFLTHWDTQYLIRNFGIGALFCIFILEDSCKLN